MTSSETTLQFLIDTMLKIITGEVSPCVICRGCPCPKMEKAVCANWEIAIRKEMRDDRN